ncbi:MAG: PQQ-binding-like beta-propeller repeat protein [Planctomycetota bacterium]
MLQPSLQLPSATSCLLLFLLVTLSGCRKVDPNLTSDGLPEFEPTTADKPDKTAAELFQIAASERGKTPHNSSWPQLFGPDRTSFVDTTINPIWEASGPTEIWSIPVGTGYGSPVIADDMLVFNHRIDQEEIIQCVRAESGESVWEHRYPTTYETEYEYSNGPYSTPVIAQNKVYTIGGQGQCFCLDLSSGTLAWSRDLFSEYEVEDDIFAFGSTPLVTDEYMILNLGASSRNAGIIALHPDTGATIWEATDHGAGYCSPFAATIHGQRFVFVFTALGLVSLNPENGQVDWSIEHRSRSPMSYNAVSPLVLGDKVLVVTGPGPGAICVRVLPDRGYEQVWKHRRVIDCQFNSLMLHDGQVYGFTAAGQGGAELRCIDFETGELRWKYHSLLRRGQGLIAGDALVLLGERGHLASMLLSNESPQVISFTDQPLMSEPSYCAPAIANGRLYLKDENRLACFEVNP